MRFTRARTPAEVVVVVRATAIPNARRAADHAASQAARSDADAICRARQEHLSVAHVRHEGANTRCGARSFFLPRSWRSFTPAAVFAAEAKQHELQLPL